MLRILATAALLSAQLAPLTSHALLRVKLDEKAANSNCLRSYKGDASQLLAEKSVTYARVDEQPVPGPVISALATVIANISSFGKGTFREFEAAHFLFGKEWSYSWYQSGNTIHLNPGNENVSKLTDKRFDGVNNAAVLTHELAHYMSLHDPGMMLQRLYMDAVTTPCLITDYSKTDRYEEFAEVFTAYTTNPELFADKGPACEAARLFMATQIFEEDLSYSESCESRLRSVRMPSQAGK